LDIYIFPGADNDFELYEDDGETTDYQHGKYAITRFSLRGNTFTIHPAQGDVSVIPQQRTYRIHINSKVELEPFALVPHESHTIELRPS
jgi:alpha-glucosidase (family GH31 glycosyl hydrolase)